MYRGDEKGGTDSDNVLDRWILARLQQTIFEMTSALDEYELDRSAKPLGDFLDDLSTWYVRRSRERFKGDNAADKKAALETTRFILEEFSKLLAPFMPFTADDIYSKVTKGGKEESVHLDAWPASRELNSENVEVIENMELVREIVSLGLEARAKAGIKVRQPLRELKIKGGVLEGEYLSLVKDEVNVKEVAFDESLAENVMLDTNITSELKEEGDLRDLIRAIQDFRKKEGLTPSDKVKLEVTASKETSELIEKHTNELKRAALLSDLKVNLGENISFRLIK